MINILFVGLGGALGSIMRYCVGMLFSALNLQFPYGTLVCNVLGSLLLGAIVGMGMKSVPSEALRLFLTIGVCGGFTTFSTFSLDAIKLLQSGSWLMFISYTLITIFAGFIALYIGLRL